MESRERKRESKREESDGEVKKQMKNKYVQTKFDSRTVCPNKIR